MERDADICREPPLGRNVAAAFLSLLVLSLVKAPIRRILWQLVVGPSGLLPVIALYAGYVSAAVIGVLAARFTCDLIVKSYLHRPVFIVIAVKSLISAVFTWGWRGASGFGMAWPYATTAHYVTAAVAAWFVFMRKERRRAGRCPGS